MGNTQQFSATLLLLGVAIAVFHYAGLLQGFYWTISWYDIPMHIAGGVFIGTLFFRVFGTRYTEMPRWIIAVSAIGFTAFIGVLWEFYEYGADVFVFHRYPWGGGETGQTFDTLLDLANDIIGAFVVCAGTFFIRKETRRIS